MAVVTDVTAVVEEVMPAMVMIHNNYTASASYFGYVQQEEATASGSGIIVGENDSELLIATNYHVIEGADSLEVIFNDDTTVEAVVKGTDSDMDLAVIAVMLDDIDDSTREVIKIATLGDSTALKLGEPAIAIGNALGYGQSVTTGVISAVNRDVEISEGVTQTFIQTDAAINPGNSGGALLNLQGEVIGINSNKIGGDTIEGMGYAIPISVAQPIIDKLMNEVTRVKVS
ncbi:MAG: trypsin-like peptidase domain-containing protein, partial [Butyrivibrio sp.]|nr:trypsin-like peptidase domain-containing protein [Butyrivibrio sp.]